MLVLPKAIEATMRKQLEAAYPNEGCGVMLGKMEGEKKVVQDILLLTNTREEGAARTRYLIDPKGFLHAEKTARERGLDIVGIYHSHPDHPARASQYDQDHAWPIYSYVIVAVAHGKSTDMNSFVLTDQQFQLEPIRDA